jgi:hypothetical protein
MVSQRRDPDEFVQAAARWSRLRVESELRQEIAAAELARDRGRSGLGATPAGCYRHLTFLRQLSTWLQTGTFPRQGRRRTRALIATLAEVMVSSGQLDENLLKPLRRP